MGKALLFAAKVVLYLFLLLFVLGLFGGMLVPLVEILFKVSFGWVNFLRRVLPEVTLNASAIVFALVCSALLLWGAQWFCGWLYAHHRIRQPADSSWPANWPWRWTVGAYCGLWLLFLAAMSITGVVHQVGWLVRSDKPIIEDRRPRERWEIGAVARHVEARCGQVGWTNQSVREACEEAISKNSYRRDESPAERWHLVFIEPGEGKTTAVFIAYRDPELRRKYGYRRVTPEGVTEGAIDRLTEDIRTMLAKAGTFVK